LTPTKDIVEKEVAPGWDHGVFAMEGSGSYGKRMAPVSCGPSTAPGLRPV